MIGKEPGKEPDKEQNGKLVVPIWYKATIVGIPEPIMPSLFQFEQPKCGSKFFAATAL